MTEVLVAAGLVALAACYGVGCARMNARPNGALGAVHVLAFVTAFGALLLALVSPLESEAESSLTAHMVQHLLLIVVAPPLLVAAATGTVVWRALPFAGTRPPAVVRTLGRARRHLGVWIVLAAVAAQALVMGVWHVPVLYDAAVERPMLHAAEHLTLLGSSLLLWWAIAGRSLRRQPAVSLLALFVSSLACTALGVAMVLARAPWYESYARGLRTSEAIADQQMAGIVMWGFGGTVIVVAGAVAAWAMIQRLERHAPARPITAATRIEAS